MTMDAYELVGPRTLVRNRVEAPNSAALASDEVLVGLEVGGICGSDLPFYLGISHRAGVPSPGGFPLHEIVGAVIAAGSAVDLEPGTRVVGWARDFNGLAEQVVTGALSVLPVTAELPASEAIGLQPLACVIDALDRIRDVDSATVTILGLGPIGALFAHVLKARGAGHIRAIDRVDRSGVASDYCVDEFVHTSARAWASTVRDNTELQTDLVIEAIGHQAGLMADAVDVVRDHGSIYCFGIPDDEQYAMPFADFLRKNATLMAGYTAEPRRRRALKAAAAYAAEHPDFLAHYVTHLRSFEQANEAFELAVNPCAGQLKVAVACSEVEGQ